MDQLPADGSPATVRWQPDRAVPASPRALPPFLTALGRGARNRCPVCGEGRVFAGYLRVVPECAVCGTPLGSLRADDAPPYFTIFIVGHLLLPPVFWIETAYQPPIWLHMVVWLPLFAAACILLLRPVKGATVGLMLKLGFTGREDAEREEATLADRRRREGGPLPDAAGPGDPSLDASRPDAPRGRDA